MNTQAKIKSIELQALTIGGRILKIIEHSGNSLTVQGVFDHALYLQSRNDELLKVIVNEGFLSPASILVSGDKETGIRSSGIHAETEFVYEGGSLTSRDSACTIDLDNAGVFTSPEVPAPEHLSSLEEINLNLRVLKDTIYTAPSREGLVPLLEKVEKLGPMEVYTKEQKPSMSEKARPFIDGLMWGVFGGDLEAIKNSAGQILGLGPGLTPSCDDFLAGLLMSINTAGASIFGSERETVDFFNKFSSEISDLAKEKTTIYSQSLLSEAAAGEGPQNALDLILSVVTKSPEQVAEHAKSLISVGATSGADISIGIYYGIRFLTSRIEMRELIEFE